MAEAAPERFFYHSFPRRSRFTPAEIEEGCTILGIIRDHGLALVPQVTQWKYAHANGTPNRTSEVLQQRVDLRSGAEQKCTEVGGAAYWRFHKANEA